MRGHPITLAAAIMLAVAGLGGCGAANEPTASGPGTTTVQRATTLPTAPAPGQAAKGTRITVTGLVESGVERNCVVLRADHRVFLLVDAPQQALRLGERMQVIGTLHPELATSCMQGIPLRVETMQAVDP